MQTIKHATNGLVSLCECVAFSTCESCLKLFWKYFNLLTDAFLFFKYNCASWIVHLLSLFHLWKQLYLTFHASSSIMLTTKIDKKVEKKLTGIFDQKSNCQCQDSNQPFSNLENLYCCFTICTARNAPGTHCWALLSLSGIHNKPFECLTQFSHCLHGLGFTYSPCYWSYLADAFFGWGCSLYKNPNRTVSEIILIPKSAEQVIQMIVWLSLL